MALPARAPLGAIDLNAVDTSALDPELVETLAAGGKIDLRQFRGNPDAMAAAKKAIALRIEKEKAEKMAAKQAMKAEKLGMKATGGFGHVAEMQDAQMEPVGSEE